MPVSTGRDTNNNLEESQKTEVISPTSTNWGWWKNTSKHVADWMASNEFQAAKESQHFQKKNNGQRKRTLSRKGSNRYRASFRPKKGKTQ